MARRSKLLVAAEGDGKKPRTPMEELQAQITIDPLSPIYPHYKPSPTQAAFHQSMSYYKLLTAGGRAGKTTAAVIDLAWAMRGIHPWKPWRGPFVSLVFGVSRQQVAMVTGKKLLMECELPGDEKYPLIGTKPLIPAHEIADIGSIKVGFRCVQWVKMKNGCEMHFQWAGADKVELKIQGGKIGYIVIDENAGSHDLIVESYKRLQDSQRPGTWHGCLVWNGHGTADNEGYTEFKKRCIDGLNGHELFHIQSGETGAVTAEAKARFASILTEDERKVHIDATADRGDLVRIFRHQWDESKLCTHEPYILEDSDNLHVSYDPGVDHPTGMELSAIKKGDPRCHIFQCWNRTGGTIYEDVELLRQGLGGRKISTFIYDTNLKNKDRSGGRSVLEQMKTALADAGIIPFAGFWQSKKLHAPGINLMREEMAKCLWLLYLDPRHLGVCMLVEQLLKYRGKEGTKFTGPGGVVKRDDELCLVAGTSITTDRGDIPIEDVRPEIDLVLTRNGFKPVSDGGITAFNAEVFTVITASGKRITGTAGHRVWTAEHGWTRIDSLRYNDTLLAWSTKSNITDSVSIHKRKLVADHVVGVFWSSVETVYDLTVPGSAEFFANGILVHNCDTRRYKVMALNSIGRAWREDWQCGKTTIARIELQQTIVDADPHTAALRERGRLALAYRSKKRIRSHW